MDLPLDLGFQPPWRLVGQDTDKQPHEVFLEVAVNRGAEYLCPECGRLCTAHDFHEFTWRYRNFPQHHCYVTARGPLVDCPDHGTPNRSRCPGPARAAGSPCCSSRRR
ncbi:hypothetical protein DFAR_2310010 [Desulfarculales bacterium]